MRETELPCELSISVAAASHVEASLALARACVSHMQAQGIDQWGRHLPGPRHDEERAYGAGYRSLRLDAFAGNLRALRFYERLGYAEAGRVRFRKGDFHCFENALGPAR